MSGEKIQSRMRKRVEVQYNRINYDELEFIDGDKFRDGGKFGSVRRAYYKKHPVAVKFFKGDERYAFTDELRNLHKLKHPHVVVMYGANPTASGNHDRYIVLEYAHNSLAKVLHYSNHQYMYNESNVYHWASQIARGLQYMHSKKVVHRDIKSTNMLVFGDGRHIKLCDFGTARDLSVTVDMTKSIGTIRYMAPEMLRGEKYTFKCDIFSYGIVLWEMIARKPPNIKFGEKMPWEMIYYAMAKKGARPPQIEGLHPFFENLINYTWHEDTDERPSAEDIVRKLSAIASHFPENPPLKRRNRKGEYVIFNPAKVKSGRMFLAQKKTTANHLSGTSSAPRSHEGTSGSGTSSRTPESSLDLIFVPKEDSHSDHFSNGHILKDEDNSPSDTSPPKPVVAGENEPLPKVEEKEEDIQEEKPSSSEEKEDNLEDLPRPMNWPRSTNPPPNDTPSELQTTSESTANRDASSPLPHPPPPQSKSGDYPQTKLGDYPPHEGRPLSPNHHGSYTNQQQQQTVTPPRDYSSNWLAYGTDVYGRTAFRPGYISPTTPYWTQAPQFETHVSVYTDHEEMAQEGVREEEYRSMNIVRQLYEKIGNQVSGDDVEPNLFGGRFNPPHKNPTSKYIMPKKATPGSEYAIADCSDPEWQPIIPGDIQESRQLYQEYLRVRSQLGKSAHATHIRNYIPTSRQTTRTHCVLCVQ
jgi:serine/threonine protein kinase